jgi:hypothetical protein
MVTRPAPKVPRTPPYPLVKDPEDVVAVAPMLWRVHRTAGAHVMEWNALRRVGPLPTMRFDPHPPPLGAHLEGVLYAACDLPTALAEALQATRLIDVVSDRPRLTAWTPTRPLSLLNLAGTWALRNGAAQSLAAAPRSTCRAWARAVRAAWPDLDGLQAPSTMTGVLTAVLWDPAADSFPGAPAFSRQLADPMLRAIAERVAVDALGYAVL